MEDKVELQRLLLNLFLIFRKRFFCIARP